MLFFRGHWRFAKEVCNDFWVDSLLSLLIQSNFFTRQHTVFFITSHGYCYVL